MRQWIARFMMGRYGQDNLSNFMFVLTVVIMVISLFVGGTLLQSAALVLLACNTIRTFSRNITKRRQENQLYLQLKRRALGVFTRQKTQLQQRKTHCFVKCPACRTRLRLPRGKGLLSVTCPKCRGSFTKRT